MVRVPEQEGDVLEVSFSVLGQEGKGRDGSKGSVEVCRISVASVPAD